MNCIIVDDNKMARTVLKQLISSFEFLNLKAECENAMQAINVLMKEKIDLIFLDIQMPEISGIDFLKKISTRPPVILISTNPEYALEAFEYNVLDYIIKPVKEDRFLKAVLRAKEMHDSNTKTLSVEKEFFFFTEKGVASKIKISDILFIQAMGDYVVINLANKKICVHYNLSAIEKLLPVNSFFRIHRSYIVALNKIEKIEDGCASIYQNIIPVSDNQRAALMVKLNLL